MEDNKPSETGPLVYLSAEGRLDDAITAVRANGGGIVKERHPIGPHGHRAVVTDTEGEPDRPAFDLTVADIGIRPDIRPGICPCRGGSGFAHFSYRYETGFNIRVSLSRSIS